MASSQSTFYYHEENDLKTPVSSFDLQFDLKKTCSELISEIEKDPSSPFYGTSSVHICLNSSKARAAEPYEFILSGDNVLEDVVKNRKMWIVKNQHKKSKLLKADLIVAIHYLESGNIRQYEIFLQERETSPFESLLKCAKAKAPKALAKAVHNGYVALTMTTFKEDSPSCSQFTHEDFAKLQNDEIKLWIEKRVRFTQDRNSNVTIAGSDHRFCNLNNHTSLVQSSALQAPGKDLWACNHKEDHFDFFFSHRQWADKDLVKLFFEELDGEKHPRDEDRKIHPFWDKECLLTAEDWKEGFLSALKQTDIVVLFISANCLQKIKEADWQEDNMLLEWEVTLQKSLSSNLFIFPMHIGRKCAFQSFNYLDYPDVKHCHPKSPQVLTIRKVVEEIFRIQGESIVVELNPKNYENMKTKLLNTLSKVKDHETSKSTKPVISVLLNLTQDKQLRELLRPLDKEMKDERTRLMNAHVANTRLWLLKFLMEFLNPVTGTATERVLWLQGNAGVGKSVMSAFAANELEKRNLLAGMFFAKHDDTGRNSARNLIRTLCYQLCEWNADFGRIIIEKLKNEVISQEALREQANIEKMFSHLILEPLKEIEKTNSNPIVLVVDALDETGQMGFRSEILQVFSVHCKKLPSFVKLLVTSRPEDDIVKTFDKMETKPLEATSEENRNDALIYSKHFLQKHGYEEKEMEEFANLLMEKSGGLFVWLAMACRILESVAAVGQRITAAGIEKLGDGGTDGAMDTIYFSTFDRIFGKTPPDAMRDVLSFITLAFKPLKAEDFAAILDFPLEDVNEIINRLRPILFVNEEGIVRFFHKSVADYLTDPKRCSDIRFAVSVEHFHSKLTGKCLNVLQNGLLYNIAQLPLHTRHKDIPSFDQLVSENVPPHLSYAALYFWRHHWESKEKRANFPVIKAFTETKLLNWIELLSLLKSTNQIPAATSALSKYYESAFSTSTNSTDYTVELLSDTTRLFQKFNIAISASALQVYVTAVPFSPKETRIYQHFINNLPTKKLPHVAAGLGHLWPACLATLEGHSQAIASTAISKDGKWIVSGSYDKTIKIWSMESVVISADGKWIVSGSGHSSHVSSVAISTDGKWIVSGSGDKTIKIWLMESGEEIRTLTGHLHFVSSVVISTDGKWIVSGSGDKTIKIWLMESGDEIRTFTGDFDRWKMDLFQRLEWK
ncbi:hypothetical protein HK098_006245 [Nowakowskiella sp. JEL0407]|nr:hypothetical protein HK098_006245 [Nowakowskiella sp. JEL0407]